MEKKAQKKRPKMAPEKRRYRGVRVKLKKK
jgi:hypothetical protein